MILTTRVEVDPRAAAGGSPLPAGDFEVRANVSVAGFSHARSVRRNGAPLVLTSSPPRSSYGATYCCGSRWRGAWRRASGAWSRDRLDGHRAPIRSVRGVRRAAAVLCPAVGRDRGRVPRRSEPGRAARRPRRGVRLAGGRRSLRRVLRRRVHGGRRRRDVDQRPRRRRGRRDARRRLAHREPVARGRHGRRLRRRPHDRAGRQASAAACATPARSTSRRTSASAAIARTPSPPFSFADEFRSLGAARATRGRQRAESDGATVTLQPWGELQLVGSSSGLNVFTIDAADVAGGQVAGLSVTLPSESASALINVTTNTAITVNAQYLNVIPAGIADQLIWNLPRATASTSRAESPGRGSSSPPTRRSTAPTIRSSPDSWSPPPSPAASGFSRAPRSRTARPHRSSRRPTRR